VTSRDHANCTASPFDLEASVPEGWTAALGTLSLALAPGATASTTLEVTSPHTAPDGFYAVGVSVRHGADAGRSASVSASYVVSSGAGAGMPVAVDDRATAFRGVALTLDVLANDWDPDNDPLTLIDVTQGSRGSVVINADSTVTYRTESYARSSDSFEYTISDGANDATATVWVDLEKQVGTGRRKR
jgi:hypothetical protein